MNDNFPPEIRRIFNIVSKFYNMEEAHEIGGGAVNRLFKVKTDQSTYFLKYRPEYAKDFPDVPLNQADIKYEVDALSFFSKLMPNTFPSVVQYFEDDHFFLMTDVLNDTPNLKDQISQTPLSPSQAENLGKTIAKMHRLGSEGKQDFPESIPSEGFFKMNLDYKFDSIPYGNKLIEELSQKERQPIHGDLSPKNIGYHQGEFKFFDLEYAHQGSIDYEVGFLLSHVILEQRNQENLDDVLKSFIKGYEEENPGQLDHNLIGKVALGTMLFRLATQRSNYDFGLNKEEIEKIYYHAEKMLNPNYRESTRIGDVMDMIKKSTYKQLAPITDRKYIS